jgi:tetratricopeptide (TPR) repeat protein
MSQHIPNPEIIEESVGRLDRFIEYAVQVLRSKNWTKKLLLIDVVLFLIFNPVSFARIVELFGFKAVPTEYPRYFWLAIGGIFVAAAIIAWLTRPKERTRYDLAARSAIKGLLPYGKEDAELFAQLQREYDLVECSQAITASDFRFGVLCGESGSGKTSFLQAGLSPQLAKLNHSSVYVKITELDPIESIRQALLDQLGPIDGDSLPMSLPRMFEVATRLTTRPLAVIIDQFEQFFVHRPRKQDRMHFLSQMQEWFKQRSLLPVKVIISLRSDFLDRLIELQKLLGYSLGPYQNFRLDKFEPTQAAAIFKTIATHEKLTCDFDFVQKMAAEELASADDGLISPVDIQVLAWMIAGQRREEDRAFNEKTFHKLGGVDGLLERFLTRVLDARETETRKQAAIKTLLALTDLDRNARAGVLTRKELEEKLQDHLTRTEIAEAIQWLARGDVRLIAPVKRKKSDGKEVEGYELAHERLIPALRRIVGKQLGDADRAQQLLDRRTNEWLGSDRSSRYLFSFSELRLINRYRKLITWGKEQQAKEALLRASSRHFLFLYTAAGFAILLMFVGWRGWHSNAWQVWLIKRDLRNYGKSLRDGDALSVIAQAFAYTGDLKQSSEILNRITDNYVNARAQVELADSYTKLGEKDKASAMLGDAATKAEQIADGRNKAFALDGLARSYAKLGEKEKAATLLADAVKAALLTRDDKDRAGILMSIASSYAWIGGTMKDRGLMAHAVKTMELVNDDREKDLVLNSLALSYAQLSEKQKDSTLLSEAVKMEGLTSNDGSQGFGLTLIASYYAKLGEKEKATALLGDALGKAQLISNNLSKVYALSSIAESYAKFGDKEIASALLADAVKKAEKINDNVSEVRALESIAEAYSEPLEKEKASALLRNAVKKAELISVDESKASALNSIAQSYAKLGEKRGDGALLADAIKAVGLINEVSYRDAALNSIATSYARLGVIRKDSSLVAEAVKTVGLTSNNNSGTALEAIAESYAKLGEIKKDSALIAEAVKTTRLMIDGQNKGAALGVVAASYVKLSESSNNKSSYDQTFHLMEGLGSDESRDIVLNSILSSKLAVGDVGRLSSLTSPYSEVRKAMALARILIAVSHPELIENDEIAQADDEQTN